MIKTIKIPKRVYYYLLYLIAAGIYIGVSLVAPIEPNRYNLNPSNTRLLELTIIIPVVIIWAFAVYGAVRFKGYTASISQHRDGRALDKVASGLLWLTAAVIVSTLIGVTRSWALKDHWLAVYTIFDNYVIVVMPLIAYIYMYSGSRQALRQVKRRRQNRWGGLVLAIFLLGLAAAYFYAVLSYNYRQYTPDPNRYNSFYMSDPLILGTLALPYLVGWGLGIKAALNLDEYRRLVKGVIYRRALARLVSGILIVVLFYIVLQLLVSFSTYIATADLAAVLIVLYLLILLYALGFLVIASGSRLLNRIERVK